MKAPQILAPRKPVSSLHGVPITKNSSAPEAPRLALQTPLPRPVPPCEAPPLGAPDGAGGAAGREGRAPLRFQPGGPAELSSPPLSTPLPVFSVQSFVEQGVCPARPSPSRETPARIHPSAGVFRGVPWGHPLLGAFNFY